LKVWELNYDFAHQVMDPQTNQLTFAGFGLLECPLSHVSYAIFFNYHMFINIAGPELLRKYSWALLLICATDLRSRQMVMSDPVILRDSDDGISYERAALEEFVTRTG
jgi:hypothetical protein